ncbi:MAG: TCR/Tet family MFS transporter [Verrucomicrobiaceae bacterium]|nr:TCR/Tet family MFS transporter [Verrucomicrobiaceae bacterium]
MLHSRKPAVVFIFITLFLDILGVGLIVPILPKLIEEFKGGDVEKAAQMVGLMAALYSGMQFLCAPFLGSLSDQVGRRKVILLSVFGSGIDYLLLAFAPSLGWFFIGRMISGITGANYSAATAYIADVTPKEKRAQAFGLVGAAFGLGFIAGPAIGGLLGHYGLRVPFFAAAGLTLVNWLYGLLVLPESLAPENRRQFSWSRSNPFGALLALKRYPMVLELAGVWFLLSFAHQVYPSTWVLYMDHRFGWGVRETGLSLALVGVTSAIVSGGLTRLIIPRIGERRAVLWGIGIGVVEYACFGSATAGWMIYTIIVFGAVAGIANPAAQGIVSQSVAADEQGVVQGTLNSLASVAGILGPPTAATLFGYFISDHAPVHLPGAAFYLSACVDTVALVLAVRAFRKIKVRADAERASEELR